MNVRYGGVEAAFTITSVNDHDAAKTHASKVRLLTHYMHLHACIVLSLCQELQGTTKRLFPDRVKMG